MSLGYRGFNSDLYSNKSVVKEDVLNADRSYLGVVESKYINKVDYNYIGGAKSVVGSENIEYVEELIERKQVLAGFYHKSADRDGYVINIKKSVELLKGLDKSFSIENTPIVSENYVSYYILQGGTLIAVIDEESGKLLSLVKVSGDYVELDAVCNVVSYKGKPQKAIWSYDSYLRGVYTNMYKGVAVVDSRCKRGKKDIKTNNYNVVGIKEVLGKLRVNSFYLKEDLKEAYAKDIKKAKYIDSITPIEDKIAHSNIEVEVVIEGKKVVVSEEEAISNFIVEYSFKYIDYVLAKKGVYEVNVEGDTVTYMGRLPIKTNILDIKQMLCDRVYSLNNDMECYTDIDGTVTIELFESDVK